MCWLLLYYNLYQGFPGSTGKVIKNLPINAGDIRNADLIPRSGRSPGGRQGNPLQYSCLKIPWTEELGRLWPIGLQSRTRLKQLSIHGEESQLQSPNRKPETQRKEIVSTSSIHRGVSQPESSWGTSLFPDGKTVPFWTQFSHLCGGSVCI